MKNLRKLKAEATALAFGIRDGWRQPHQVDWSRNVEHLADASDRVFNIQDLGINLGQFARAGFKSESWTQAFAPFNRIKKEN